MQVIYKFVQLFTGIDPSTLGLCINNVIHLSKHSALLSCECKRNFSESLEIVKRKFLTFINNMHIHI